MKVMVERLLQDAIERWQQFAAELVADSAAGSEFHSGLATGLAAAAEELQALLHQAQRAERSPLRDDPLSLAIRPQDTPSTPAWEYTYIGVAQDAAGLWRVTHLNGVWQPHWEQGLTLDEAVQQLQGAGWKLVRFANGLHVFKRTVQA